MSLDDSRLVADITKVSDSYVRWSKYTVHRLAATSGVEISQGIGGEGIPPGRYEPPFPLSRSWIGGASPGGISIRSRPRTATMPHLSATIFTTKITIVLFTNPANRPWYWRAGSPREFSLG